MSAAATALVAVVVLSKHHPDQLWVDGCTRDGRAVSVLYATKKGVKSCDRERRCRTRPEAKLECPGGARVRSKSTPPRTYGRTLRVSVDRGVLRAISDIEVEQYVSGVVAAELTRAPEEARKAQAIVVRTFALNAKNRPRHTDADLCDLTHCQLLRSVSNDPIIAKTAGLTLKREGKLAPVFFHSTCGGHTRDAHDVWPDLANVHIVGVSDVDETGRAYCGRSSHFRWVSEIDEDDLARALTRLAGRDLDPSSLVLEANGDRFEIRDDAGGTAIPSARLHSQLARALGWSQVKSPIFEAERAGHVFRFRGRGLGHDVGLCQHGAMERARRGATSEEILRAYFPNLEIATE